MYGHNFEFAKDSSASCQLSGRCLLVKISEYHSHVMAIMALSLKQLIGCYH